jgi:hypothetical protein
VRHCVPQCHKYTLSPLSLSLSLSLSLIQNRTHTYEAKKRQEPHGFTLIILNKPPIEMTQIYSLVRMVDFSHGPDDPEREREGEGERE